MLETQAVIRARSRAWAKTGNRMAARIAIMAITTRSSIRVKPPGHRRFILLSFHQERGATRPGGAGGGRRSSQPGSWPLAVALATQFTANGHIPADRE